MKIRCDKTHGLLACFVSMKTMVIICKLDLYNKQTIGDVDITNLIRLWTHHLLHLVAHVL